MQVAKIYSFAPVFAGQSDSGFWNKFNIPLSFKYLTVRSQTAGPPSLETPDLFGLKSTTCVSRPPEQACAYHLGPQLKGVGHLQEISPGFS